MLRHQAKAIDSFSEAVCVLFIQKTNRDRTREEHILKWSKRIKSGAKIVLWAGFLGGLFLKSLGIISRNEEKDALKKKLIEVYLLQTLSYYEWKDFNQIWNSLKNDEKVASTLTKLKMDTGNVGKNVVFIFLFGLGDLGIVDMRLENKEEYIKYRTTPEKINKYKERRKALGIDPTKDDSLFELAPEIFGKRFDSLEELNAYQKVFHGMRLVFLRKPIGTTKPDVNTFQFFSLIPGMGR
jgi:hypothetical protein